MSEKRSDLFTGPVFIVSAFSLFAVAIVEKVLNVVGSDLPLINVFPRQLLDWAVALLMFDIALGLRQMLELKRSDPSD